MYFEVAGFQYSLMPHLAGDAFRNSQALDAAFLALASQAASTGKFMNEPVTEAARQFATKVVMIANRRGVPARAAAMTAPKKTTAARQGSMASEASRTPKNVVDSAPERADLKSANQSREDNPFTAFSEWGEDVDTKTTEICSGTSS